MSSETERLLAQGPREAPDPTSAGVSRAVAQRPQRSLGGLGRALVLVLAVLVLVGLTVAHELGPGIVIASWLVIGLVQFLRRQRGR